MATPEPSTQDETSTTQCLPPNPCEAACIIEHAILMSLQKGGRAVKRVTYQGRTTEWEHHISLRGLKEMLAYYKAQCAVIDPSHPSAQGPARTGPLVPCLGGIT